jgi:hypothetical protein
VASLRGESSNQLFDSLEEWNTHLERHQEVIEVGNSRSSAMRSKHRSDTRSGDRGVYLDHQAFTAVVVDDHEAPQPPTICIRQR